MKKSILFVVPTLTIGGVERVLVNLVNELVQDFDVTIITIYDYFDLKEKLNNSVTVKSFYKTSKFKIWNYMKVRLYTGMLKKMPSSLLYRVLVKEKYDVEIAFMRGAQQKLYLVQLIVVLKSLYGCIVILQNVQEFMIILRTSLRPAMLI